ncbi:hypothetical protein H2248_009020 [Termitomyces sp. 'cryptogamus']|nr:hypothetical protein H2248_009020 [Termitomyces sp. 'cryptogamus']
MPSLRTIFLFFACALATQSLAAPQSSPADLSLKELDQLMSKVCGEFKRLNNIVDRTLTVDEFKARARAYRKCAELESAMQDREVYEDLLG